ncbi:unnamed protein product [Didymodactylos carnosus]|uniref:Sec16 Sec23-binding domain-containing protein n=1 Tax=Didymodactylos carnosus TaxID=1234261 RepID=A0A813TTF9_9BILA|nr:unnamed protein product [Didymodactylos carnosus]CAF3602066.1 unnamed protein product [Didymodactylos carnosus]
MIATKNSSVQNFLSIKLDDIPRSPPPSRPLNETRPFSPEYPIHRSSDDISNDSNRNIKSKPIFLSYSNQTGFNERYFVIRLYQQLIENGLNNVIWFDHNEGVHQDKSASWFADRLEAIDLSVASLVIISDAYCHQRLMNIEVKAILDRKLASSDGTSSYQLYVIFYDESKDFQHFASRADFCYQFSSTELLLSIEERVSIVLGHLTTKLQPYKQLKDQQLIIKPVDDVDKEYHLKKICEWNKYDIQKFLVDVGVTEASRDLFQEQNIDGFLLLSCTEIELKQRFQIDNRTIRRQLIDTVIRTIHRERQTSNQWHHLAKQNKPKTDWIYLIYDPEDYPLALQIMMFLRSKKFKVFTHQTHYGRTKQEFLALNGPSMAQTKDVIYLLTKKSSRSTFTFHELTLAEWFEKPIVTLYIENIWYNMRSSIRALLADYPAVDFAHQSLRESLVILHTYLHPQMVTNMANLMMDTHYVTNLKQSVQPLISMVMKIKKKPTIEANNDYGRFIYLSYSNEKWNILHSIERLTIVLELNHFKTGVHVYDTKNDIRENTSDYLPKIQSKSSSNNTDYHQPHQNSTHRNLKRTVTPADIQRCRIVLLCLTTNYFKNENCLNELRLAELYNKPIIICILRYINHHNTTKKIIWNIDEQITKLTSNTIPMTTLNFLKKQTHSCIDLSTNELFSKNSQTLIKRLEKILTNIPNNNNNTKEDNNFSDVSQQQKQEQQIPSGLTQAPQWPPQMYPGYPPQFMPPGYGMPYGVYPPMFSGVDPNRPPSRQSISNDYSLSSSRSIIDGSTGGPSSASTSDIAQAPTQPQPLISQPQQFPGFIPPGMFNPWFDPFWVSVYGTFSHPYGYGYTDEMMKYYRNMIGAEDDRYSHHSNYSQSKVSQHSSSLHTWGSIDSLNDAYYQGYNPTINGTGSKSQQPQYQQPQYQQPQHQQPQQQLRRPVQPQQVQPNLPPNDQDQNKLLLTTTKPHAPVEQKEESSEEDDDEDDDSEESQRSEDDASSDRFSIKSDLAGVVEETARRTPLLLIRPHLRVKFSFDQIIKVLPQSPSDTGQPATVEIVDSNNFHDHSQILDEERQILVDFIGPLTASTGKQNVLRYCEKQAQSVLKTSTAIDKDALSLLWQYMALLVKTNAMIDVRIDIPKLLWTASTSDTILNNSHELSPSSTTNDQQTSIVQNSLREFLMLGEIDNSVQFACKNHLDTHALIISYQTDERLFKKTMSDIISNLDNGDILKTFYELGTGSTPSVVTNVTKPHYGDWRRHLAVIVANRTESNASFVDLCIKTMGDTLGEMTFILSQLLFHNYYFRFTASSGRIYSSHFCYLIGNIPFGSYRNNADKLAVLGSTHVGQSHLSFAELTNIQLTEVYEYAIRKSLPTFTPLKIYYTSKLVLYGLRQEAFAYCEEIGRTLVISQGNLTHLQLSDLQLFITIAEKSRAFNRNFQLDPSTYEDPSWLIKIRHLFQIILGKTFHKTISQNLTDNNQFQNSQKPVENYIENKETSSNLFVPSPPSADVFTSSLPTQTASVPPPSFQYNSTNYSANNYPTTATNSELPSYSQTQNTLASNYYNNLTVDTSSNQQQNSYYQPVQEQEQLQSYNQNLSDQQWQTAQQQQNHPEPRITQTEVPQQQRQHFQIPTEQQPFQISSQSLIPNKQPSYIMPDQMSTHQTWYQPPGVEHQQSSQQILQSERETLPLNEQVYDEYRTNDNHLQQNGYHTKKSYDYFDDDDDEDDEDDDDSVFSNKSGENKMVPRGKSNVNSNLQQPKTSMIGGFFDRITTIWPKKLPHEHLSNDKIALNYDEKGGRSIVPNKPADENKSALITPLSVNASLSPGNKSNTTSSQQSLHFNSMATSVIPQQLSQSSQLNPMTNTTSTTQAQTRSVNFNSARTTTVSSQIQSQPAQLNSQIQSTQSPPQFNSQPQPFDSQMQSQQHQPPLSANNLSQQPSMVQQYQTSPLSQAQQKLQNIREKQKQQQQQIQTPPLNTSNQYSLKNRQNQSRYVDILASKAVPVNPNLSLNDLGAITSTMTQSNYFIPGPTNNGDTTN